MGSFHQKHPVAVIDETSLHTTFMAIIIEEPLSIRIEGAPYVVVMRTPGDEINHAAGFCLGEGLVDSPDDLKNIGYCADATTNVITVTLQPQRLAAISHLLERKGFVSQTSCGICGKEVMEDICQVVSPIQKSLRITGEQLRKVVETLPPLQSLFNITRSSHAVVLVDKDLNPVSHAEDVGRHNALDKAIGNAFLNHLLESVQIAVLSSRISYEMVQKAARARIPVLCGLSRPTALAVTLADQIGMTLVSLLRDNKVYVYTHPDRVSV